MRPNIKVQSSNRELHEAMGLRQYYGKSVQSQVWTIITIGLLVFWGCIGYWLLSGTSAWLK